MATHALQLQHYPGVLWRIMLINRNKESRRNNTSQGVDGCVKQFRFRWCPLLMIFFAFTDSGKTKPRGGGVIVLQWNFDVLKTIVCSLVRSLRVTAEMERRPVRFAARNRCPYAGSSPVCRKLDASYRATSVARPLHVIKHGRHSCDRISVEGCRKPWVVLVR